MLCGKNLAASAAFPWGHTAELLDYFFSALLKWKIVSHRSGGRHGVFLPRQARRGTSGWVFRADWEVVRSGRFPHRLPVRSWGGALFNPSALGLSLCALRCCSCAPKAAGNPAWSWAEGALQGSGWKSPHMGTQQLIRAHSFHIIWCFIWNPAVVQPFVSMRISAFRNSILLKKGHGKKNQPKRKGK